MLRLKDFMCRYPIATVVLVLAIIFVLHFTSWLAFFGAPPTQSAFGVPEGGCLDRRVTTMMARSMSDSRAQVSEPLHVWSQNVVCGARVALLSVADLRHGSCWLDPLHRFDANRPFVWEIHIDQEPPKRSACDAATL